MYQGFKASSKPIVGFIDSDSIVAPNCIKELVRPLLFSKSIAAVCGHAYVSNASSNAITKMQEIRYFNAFRAIKGFESMLGIVSCCSGCCSAYRRKDLNKIMGYWRTQEFLGEKCTYGDDRSLTNLLLKAGKKTVYSQNAISYTKVPDTYMRYLKQQLRWKKSWVRESIIQVGYMFTKSPLFILITSLNILLPLLAPFVVFRYLFWYAGINFFWSAFLYLLGLIFSSVLYGLFYKAYNPQAKGWFSGSIIFSFVNTSLIWQIPYAFLKLKDTQWGTR